MKPLIKYRGGKSKEIPSFIKYIPNNFETYYEPFFGGGAVFFHLEPQKAVLNDINIRLMNFYKDIQKNYTTVRQQLDELQTTYETNQNKYSLLKNIMPSECIENKNESLYYLIRDIFNKKIPSNYLDSVVYFFINKTAYSGMIRYNAQGDFNVPFGRYKNFNTKLITIKHHELLKKATLLTGDYSPIFSMASENDFMFLDPPYDCIFNDYGNINITNGFNEDEHRRLAKNFQKLKCKALMIIGKTPLTLELYKDFIREEYFKSYAVNIRNRFKSESQHIIVTNY